MKLSTNASTMLADEALNAFWQVIARRFPQACTGDLGPDRASALQSAAEQAIEQWVENNVPDATT